MFRFFSQPWSCLLRFAVSAVVLVLVGCRQNPATASGSCENLTSLSLPNTTITAAQTVAAGAFTPPAPANATNPPTPFVDLPAFCRVTATIKSAGSDVKAEVWIPAQGWNGDFQPAGAGFWGGSIPFARMREILRTGAATAGTNLGVEGAAGPSFAIEHPGEAGQPRQRAVPRDGGSSQSRHSSLLWQATGLYLHGRVRRRRFSRRSRLHSAMARRSRRRFVYWIYELRDASWCGANVGLSGDPQDAGELHPPSKYPLINQTALAACDGKDGVKDGLIEDPLRCRSTTRP